MKSAHEILWENETRRLNHEVEERDWQKLVGAARTPVWLFALTPLAWLGLFAAMAYAEIGPRWSPVYTLGIFFLMALGNWWAMMKRREVALRKIIEREAPRLADKLRQERVF
ncbi:MAG: hypothetical protein HYV95_07390 [Opitutae bacterium]|nr:hypothetical protein [Opitutae bacterium]